MQQHITDAHLDLDAMLAQTQSPECGALVVFSGTVRRHNDGREVAAINYSAYKPLAEKTLGAIEQQTIERFGVTSCRIHHRIGDLEIGDMSVVVVVRAPHRAEAFEAARYAIDTVKHEVPIWKREVYTDGTQVYLRGCALHSETDHDSGQA